MNKIIYEQYKKLNESPIPLDVHKEKTYYHGTKDISGIMKTKSLIPGNLDDPKSKKWLKPQYNRTYITDKFNVALDYATQKFNDRNRVGSGAYICIINGKNLTSDITIDEDIITTFLGYFGGDDYNFDYESFADNLFYEDDWNRIENDVEKVAIYLTKHVSEKDFDKFQLNTKYGTVIGKKIIPNLPDDIIYSIIDMFGTVAVDGEILIDEIWELPKEKDLIKLIYNNYGYFKHYSKLIWKR